MTRYVSLIIAREVYEGGKDCPIVSKSQLDWIVNIEKKYLIKHLNEEFSLFLSDETVA